MSTIRVIYHGKPQIRSPKSQHPDAERYLVKSELFGRDVYVDAIGGEPTTAEVDAVLSLAMNV